MLNINFTFDNISINSIKKNDMQRVESWLSEKNDINNKIFNLKEFNDRFLEYYISESEFFLKAEVNDRIIGIIKGRIEFKNENQIWFWYFNVEDKSLSSLILKQIIEFFKKEFSIDDFYSIVDEKSQLMKFYKDNNFILSRISKNFFKSENNNLDMFILKLYK
jgi:hypothetical protein